MNTKNSSKFFNKKKVSIILCTYNEVNYVENTISTLSKTLENTEIIEIRK